LCWRAPVMMMRSSSIARVPRGSRAAEPLMLSGNGHPVEPRGVPGGMRVSLRLRACGAWPRSGRARCYDALPMVRPELGDRCGRRGAASRLAGVSPAAVSAGAPRSRLRAWGGDPPAQAERQKPSRSHKAEWRGANLRAQCESVNSAASRAWKTERWSGRALHFGAKATDCA
jgi:hypothetical protein